VLQCCCVVTDHRDKYDVNILAAHVSVMRGGVMLGEIVRYIFAAGLPVYSVLFLCDSISHPVEYHAHCLGSLLIDLVVQNSICC
jgi:hypothetical protein